mgnify:CR=1 FL=1|tara:strand:- start:653 stop:1453 length:801 start_codon:yes stop_codon:yes gene_type:complete
MNFSFLSSPSSLAFSNFVNQDTLDFYAQNDYMYHGNQLSFHKTPTSIRDMGKDNHLVILDWDDTLFPTSWLSTLNRSESEKNNGQLYSEHKIVFEEIWDLVKQLIHTLRQFTQVKIISNGSNEWIKNVAQVYYKGHARFMKEYNVSIHSARQYKNNQFVFQNQGAWKVNLFRDVVDDWKKKRIAVHQLQNLSPPNLKLLGVGDHDNDRIAIWSIDEDKGLKRKALKFLDKPNIEMLKCQIRNLTLNARNMLLSDDEINLQFENNIR